ncbi:uncharacterized protein [Heptranchias perlo]|uniref:uncharacterized protein n=1 Tax=Heptranchias perlo TaxID=212740 RepID=UPI003559647B
MAMAEEEWPRTHSVSSGLEADTSVTESSFHIISSTTTITAADATSAQQETEVTKRRGRGRPTLSPDTRKKRRLEHTRHTNKSKVYLGQAFGRWDQLRLMLSFSHAELANLLMNVYENCSCGAANLSFDHPTFLAGREVPPERRDPQAERETRQAGRGDSNPATSTPDDAHSLHPEGISETRITSQTNMAARWTPFMSSLMSTPSKHQTTADTTSVQKTETRMYETLMVTEDCDSEASSSRASSMAGGEDDFEDETMSNITAEDDVFCADLSDTVTEESNEEESIKIEDSAVPGIEVLNRKKCIADIDIIMDLLKMIHGNDCKSKGCTKKFTYHCRMIGTALVAYWICPNHHLGGRFCTVPCFKGCSSSNLQLAASILISGNNYRKIALLFKFMGLGCISSSEFYKVQRLYAAPAIVQHWKSMQDKLFKNCEGENVILCGDGRNDSAGHSAQYCTYTFSHHTRKHILNIDVVDVSEVSGKSTNIEKLGFQRSLDCLRTKLNIIEVTTNNNPQIDTLMKKGKYSAIFHSHDIWHGGKNIQKKMMKAAQKKGNDILMAWSEPIRNHFWYCAKNCNGNEVLLAERWASLLHHVVNEHEWIVPNSAGETSCNHESIHDEEHTRPWIQQNSAPLKFLRQIILDRNFLRNISRFKYFRHNSHMESFHNYLLMYASKRHSYDYQSYKLRNYLAAIDYNHHLDRSQAKNVDGTPMYRAKYSKRTKRWHTEAVKEDKKYDYVPNLMENIFFNKLQIKDTCHRSETQ